MNAIAFAGATGSNLAVGALLILSATTPPMPSSSIGLRFDGTEASVSYDPAAIGDPDSAFLTVLAPGALGAGLIAAPGAPAPGAVTDARPPRVAARPIDRALHAGAVSDGGAGLKAGT